MLFCPQTLSPDRTANFYSIEHVQHLLNEAGFVSAKARSTLLFPPEKLHTNRNLATSIDDAVQGARFVAVRFTKSCDPKEKLADSTAAIDKDYE